MRSKSSVGAPRVAACGTPLALVVGADWCPDCVRTKTCLEGLKVAFDYDDAGDPKENAAKASGSNRIPCVALPDGSFMNEPSDEALTAKLKELGVL